MKFVTYSIGATLKPGVLQDEFVYDLSEASGYNSLTDLIASGRDIGELAKKAIADAPSSVSSNARFALSAVKLHTPITRPGKIICLGLNYADHAKEGGNAKPDYPSLFLRANTSIIGHNQPLILPRVSSKLDFEAELAVIVGKHGRHLTASNALSVVAGYSCFNDGTLRDYQRRTAQWTIGKNFDGTGAFGPWMVAPDHLPFGASGLKIESRLNGQVMQSDNTANMLFPVADTLALISEAMTLEPNDVVIMGTPAGVGYARTPPVWMKAGDRIEIEIEGIGILGNTVQSER